MLLLGGATEQQELTRLMAVEVALALLTLTMLVLAWKLCGCALFGCCKTPLKQDNRDVDMDTNKLKKTKGGVVFQETKNTYRLDPDFQLESSKPITAPHFQQQAESMGALMSSSSPSPVSPRTEQPLPVAAAESTDLLHPTLYGPAGYRSRSLQLHTQTSVDGSGYGSTYSSSPLQSPLRRRSFNELLNGNAKNAAGDPQLEFALQYDEVCQKLAIYVKSAKFLNASVYSTVTEYFIRVVLIRNLQTSWYGRRISSISMQELSSGKLPYDKAEFKTKPIRRNLNPVFNECFLADLKDKDRKSAIVKFILCQIDRSGRHHTECDCDLPLAKHELDMRTEFCLPFKQYRPELGELQLTLNYMPTAERLSLTVVKAAKLRLPSSYQQTVPNSSVKAALVYRGKTMSKKRTNVQPTSADPEFQETLAFELPLHELDRAALVISLIHTPSASAQHLSACAQQINANGTLVDGVTSTSSSGGADSATDSGDRPNNPADGGGLVRRKSASNVLELARESDGGGPMSKSRSSNNMSGPEGKTDGVVIGRLAFSSHVNGSAERSHWLEAIKNPRVPLTRWHKLLP